MLKVLHVISNALYIQVFSLFPFKHRTDAGRDSVCIDRSSLVTASQLMACVGGRTSFARTFMMKSAEC